jgi:hypothetical protein
MKSVAVLTGVVLVGAIVLGFALSDAEFLNPKTSDALARRMNAETDVYTAEKEIELRTLEERAAIETQALAAQRAKELELMERDARLKSRLFELAVMLGLGVVAMVGCAAAVYLLCAGFALLRQQKQAAIGVTQENRRVVPFPGPLQRTRVSAKNSITALALLVLGVAILTASVTLL